MHEDLREGMTALSASISAVHASQIEGTATVLVSFESYIGFLVCLMYGSAVDISYTAVLYTDSKQY